MSSEEVLKCKNKGCLKPFKESENTPNSCQHHPGMPIFHDCKKGWTCCKVIVYSWDEFQLIKGCTFGAHNAQQPKTNNDQSDFYQSDQQQPEKQPQKETVEPKSIKDYEKEQLQKQEQAPVKKELTPFLTPNGKFKCMRKGCLKEFSEEDNKVENCCKHHSGEPIFHDLKKYWSCCKKETWDWDEFMKLPTCAQGQHSPKMV